MDDSELDLEFDARALFQYMADELELDHNEQYEWIFTFSHPDADKLQTTMEAIADTFVSEVEVDPDEPIGSFDDAPIYEDENGRESKGPPELTIEFYGVMTEPTLARLHEKFKKVTHELGINYLGVDFC